VRSENITRFSSRPSLKVEREQDSIPSLKLVLPSPLSQVSWTAFDEAGYLKSILFWHGFPKVNHANVNKSNY
jgi:hypothetical protein